MLKKLLFPLRNHIFSAFIPWIFFGIFFSQSREAVFISSFGALVLVVLTNDKGLKKGFVLPWGSIVVFAFLCINDWLRFIQLSPVETYRLTNSALTGIVLFSMVIGKPFTLQYAKEEVSLEHWKDPVFLRINWILTGIWAVLMTISALPSYLLSYEQIHNSWFWNYGFSIITILIGMQCNRIVPKILRK